MTKLFNNIAYVFIGMASFSLLGLLSVMYPQMTAGCYFLLLVALILWGVKTYSHGVKAHMTMNGYPGISYQAMVPGIAIGCLFVVIFLYGVSLIF